MHRGHDHDHLHNGHGGGHHHHPATAGHNHVHAPKPAAQWQTPHLSPDEEATADHHHHEPDLDLVETAFVNGFTVATDPTSFLRLAQVPFQAKATDGADLALLRVETDLVTDVGAVMPHLGGTSFRYDPMPAAMVAHRRRLRFIYFDGTALRNLSLAEIRELTPR